MAGNDSLASALSKIDQAEKCAKPVVEIKVASRLLKQVLDILNANLYVGSYEEVKDTKGIHVSLNLLGNINGCGVIKPRSSFSYIDGEKIEKKYLPARGFGLVIVSTPQGLMTLKEATERKIGGVLVAYCY
jgi:small subunit ribosomal protein S8